MTRAAFVSAMIVIAFYHHARRIGYPFRECAVFSLSGGVLFWVSVFIVSNIISFILNYFGVGISSVFVFVAIITVPGFIVGFFAARVIWRSDFGLVKASARRRPPWRRR